jgi:hypothetical protein
MGTCTDCHTPRNPKFQPIPGMEMAGGSPMALGRRRPPLISRLMLPASATMTMRCLSRPCAPVMFAHANWRGPCLGGPFKNDGRGPEGSPRLSAHSQASAPPGGQHGATYAVQTLWPKTRTGRSQLGSTLRVMNFRYSAEEAPKSLHTKDPRDPPDHGYLDYFLSGSLLVHSDQDLWAT